MVRAVVGAVSVETNRTTFARPLEHQLEDTALDCHVSKLIAIGVYVLGGFHPVLMESLSKEPGFASSYSPRPGPVVVGEAVSAT